MGGAGPLATTSVTVGVGDKYRGQAPVREGHELALPQRAPRTSLVER